MADFIRTTGEVLRGVGERFYEVRTPIGKVVHGFVERKDPHLKPEIGDRVELQFKHEDMSRARITKIVSD